jgi:NDP-sugar pyrophosphorylase family protein
MKAMILAAGLGTRLQPLTDSLPKALVPVGNKPMIQHIIERLARYNFNPIVVNVHHFADQLIDFLKNNDFGAEIIISDERNKLLDTGGGLLHAARFLDGHESFLVHNVDVFSTLDLNDMVSKHLETGALATVAVQERPSNRQLLFDSEGILTGWENIRTGEKIIVRRSYEELHPLAFGGIHVISPEIFKCHYPKEIFSIIDFYLHLAPQKKILEYRYFDNLCMDLGKIENIETARKILEILSTR